MDEAEHFVEGWYRTGDIGTAVVMAMVATGMFGLVVLMMWSVALASIIARLVMREGFADVSFRLGGRRSLYWFAVALLFPQAVGFVAFGVAWATGLAPFTSSPGAFWTSWLLASTIGTLVSCVFAAGEEIGWRGYMLTRLIDAGVPRPVLVSGVIWGLWHVPLILVGLLYAEHPSTLVAAAVFVVSATAASFVLARARLETGSVWPCILLHGAYNSVIQSAFWPAVADDPTSAVWVDMEAGILVSVALVLVAMALCRGRWTLLRERAAHCRLAEDEFQGRAIGLSRISRRRLRAATRRSIDFGSEPRRVSSARAY